MTTREKLHQIANFMESKPHWQINKDVEQYLNASLEEMTFLDETEKALEEINSGVAISFDDFSDWVDKRINNEPCEIPQAKPYV